MKKNVLFLTVFTIIFAISCVTDSQNSKPKVLVFSKTMGYKHASIPDGLKAIQKLGIENNFEVDTTFNANYFVDDSLKNYAAVIFLSTTGNVLNAKQEAAFERYIQAGGGFVGVHAATDTEYDWNWYGKLVGGYFISHPAGTPEATYHIKDTSFIATNFFEEKTWTRKDEHYNFKKLNPDVNVVLTIDETTYEGGINGDNHPMSWYHEFDGGRAFYTALGHTTESYSEEKFLKHLLGGIQYAMGDHKSLNYSEVTVQTPPDADRFTKVPLSTGEFFEPTEMTILPNNDVLIAQRRGEILRYNSQTKELSQVAYLDVYHKATVKGVNAEEGVMGLQKDPDFQNNHWVYVYYSPSGDKWVNRLSRFKFENEKFKLDTEQVILEIESQREICCHTGGSIAFDSSGLLYLSTGDNSTPFNDNTAKYVNDGFAPLNQIPGKQQYDARRTSANTNDLRGKILRIKVEEDGSYSIPKGNLFAEGTPKTRPEIYTMGHRNPYRISIDPKNGYLYWGDVGPDSNKDDFENRGPKGYDELNQAKGPGNFGWPLFIANNLPYVEYDYRTGRSGEKFDPLNPINNSVNNTGLKKLPLPQEAIIYYPYDATPDFPQVASGGRNAMAGPAYYKDLYPGNQNLPEYYDGKVIIYDWMRGWMKALTLFENGDFNKMEPFASEIKLNNLIDMELGPDGRIYLLEYGSGWFSKNDDSGLSYIAYNGGNRPPLVGDLEVDHTSGKAPLQVEAKIEGKDRENDQLTYHWNFGDGTTKDTKDNTVSYNYQKEGDYKISVTVTDDKGASAHSNSLEVIVGNTRPQVDIEITGGNSSFFMPGVPINYEVKVKDEDESIDDKRIFVTVDYLESLDEVSMSLGHQKVSASVAGKAMTLSMDCKACHKENEKSIGPTFMEISTKYKGQNDVEKYLKDKIINGSNGVWGEVTMPAHPDLSQEDARQIAVYIQSLAGHDEQKESLPSKGTIIPQPNKGAIAMAITASYTDNGKANIKPLIGSKRIILKSNTVLFNDTTKNEGMQLITFNGMNLLLIPNKTSWLALEKVDLTGVKSIMIPIGWQEAPNVGLNFEVRLNSPEGELIGKGSMSKPQKGSQGGAAMLKLNKDINKVENIYIIYKHDEKAGRNENPAAILNVTFLGK